MELKTERLKLVPCTEESVKQYACSTADMTSHVRNCLNELKTSGNCKNSQTWLLIEKNKGIVIGDIVLTASVNAQGSVHMNFQILSYARNKGYAVEALKELFSWGFAYGGVQTITTDCSKGDIYTEMILECLGMTRKKVNTSQMSWEIKKESSELVR